MNDAPVKRPPVLAGACFYLGLLAAVISVRAITMVSTWNSENRADDVAPALRGLRDAGLSADGAVSSYRTFVTVVAVLAAAGVVFAIFTARGDRASRVGMTVAIGVAGLATFAGALGATFFMAMLGGVAMLFTARLWTGEIGTYFRTLAGHPPPAASSPASPASPTPAAAPVQPSAPQPVVPQSAAQAPASFPPPVAGHPGWAPRREPLPRPVSIAVWSTLIGSIVAAGLSAILLLIVLAGFDYDAVIEQGGPGADMIGSESEFDTALRLLTALASISVVLGLAGVAASVRALVKRRAGGVPLFVLTVVTLIFSVIGFPLGIPWVVLTIVALLQLRKPEARAWFTSV
jgi:cell division septation protein DedD